MTQMKYYGSEIQRIVASGAKGRRRMTIQFKDGSFVILDTKTVAKVLCLRIPHGKSVRKVLKQVE